MSAEARRPWFEGFAEQGPHRLLPEAGFKFGQYWDVAVYERELPGA